MKQTKPGIAIILHGLLGRSIQHTIKHFRKNVVSPLEKIGTVDIFYHSWHTDSLTNPYAGESEVTIDDEVVKRLLSDAKGVIEHENKYDKTINWDLFMKRNPFVACTLTKEAAEMTLKNYKRAMESQERSWAFFEKTKTKDYDIVIATRLDVRFGQKLKIPSASLIREYQQSGDNHIWIPNFGSFNGVNDRFACGSSDAIKLWSSRVSYADKWLKKSSNESSEWLLKSWLGHNDFTIHYMPFTFQLVRANGKVPIEDSINRNYTMRVLLKPFYDLLVPPLARLKRYLTRT